VKERQKILSSFRDPNGFLFSFEGNIYRQINQSYQNNYDLLLQSGLYSSLVNDGLLISHQEVQLGRCHCPGAYKIIKPKKVKLISYPYEWSFSQLKAAALVTLTIQKRALACNMSLKDASAYNIQFEGNKPILIDTLSFEKYIDGRPWLAYRQFCQHFLAPLALMAYGDMRLNQLLRVHIDGIPLELADSLLPFVVCLKPALFLHIHLHAKIQRSFEARSLNSVKGRMSRFSHMGLLDSLESAVKSMRYKKIKTRWARYYQEHTYTPAAFAHKKRIVEDFLERLQPKCIWDIGSNTGLFSRVAAKKGIFTVSLDADTWAVEKNYLETVEKNERDIFPLVWDLNNPSPAIGWANEERLPLSQRNFPDAVLALALVHHLVINNNIPFAKIASFFSRIAGFLIVEFIPSDDEQAKKMIVLREDIFSFYTRDTFESEFQRFFTIRAAVQINDSPRWLYLMERK